MGCKSLPYWIGTFCFDFLAYVLTFGLFIFMVYAMYLNIFFFFLSLFLYFSLRNLDFLKPHMAFISLIMLCYGFSLTQFAYACGFLFNKANSAHKAFPLINYFVLYSVPWILLGLFHNYDTIKIVIQIFSYIISPFFTVDRGFLKKYNE